MFSRLQNLQSEVYHLLKNSYKKSRLVHTYLFSGEPGTLKSEASKFLASLLLCENKDACGKCKECKSILDETSSKIFTIVPDGQSIKKQQILDLEREFSLTSNDVRIFIIHDIDKATSASANSLLKFLEEANENCYGILLTENIDNVIPTIRSRCQVIYFKPINREFVYNKLLEKKVNKDLAKTISLLTYNIDEALKLAEDELFQNVYKLAKKLSDNLNTNKAITIMGTEGKFLFRESKEYNEYFLDILIAMQNYKVKMKINSNEINKEIKILEIMMELKKKIRYNLNMELAYLQMLIEIARCSNGESCRSRIQRNRENILV
ncbi:MAG TPA: hypothetical protein GXZ48_07135 [Acholeplasmataceae bacterium]|jgi:DNA polymerase-3 subunit delta'|nr:hypothetical protein [Acholeplasmataceae bacterium]